jgi:F-type H+-transporting ATPase subunit b
LGKRSYKELFDFDIINLIITVASKEEHGVFNWRFVAEYTVNLIILLAVLSYFLKEPIRNFLIERRGIIGNEIDEAQKTIAQAKKKYEEYLERMKNIESEIEFLKEVIRKEGEIEREEIVKQAELASKKIRDEASEAIKLQAERVRHDIQNEIVSLVVGLAENIIKQKLDEADERKIFESFIKKLEGERWHQLQH